MFVQQKYRISRDKFGFSRISLYLCILFKQEKKMPEYDIAQELALLHVLEGAEFVRQLKNIIQFSIFKPKSVVRATSL